MSPDDPQAHGIRAGVWVVQGRFDDAVRECEIAIAGAPSDAYLWCVFGQVLICAGDAARGERALREAMQLNPFHPSYYRGILGNALEELGRNAEAIEILTKLSVVTPTISLDISDWQVSMGWVTRSSQRRRNLRRPCGSIQNLRWRWPRLFTHRRIRRRVSVSSLACARRGCWTDRWSIVTPLRRYQLEIGC